MRRHTGLKIFLIVLCAILLSAASYFTVDAIVENNKVKEQIKNFLAKDKTCSYSQKYDMNFCRVIEGRKDSPAFHTAYVNIRDIFDPEWNLFVGDYGDIIVSLESEMIPPIKQFMNLYAGGHAALIAEEALLIEITGIEKRRKDNVVMKGINYWLDDFVGIRDSFVGLYVKGISREQRNQVMEKAESFLGQPYNYSFIFNTKKKHYCTDIISKAYAVIDKNLDEDRLIVTAQDLILSKDTDIFLYKEINKTIKVDGLLKGTHNVYFLDDGEQYDDYF